MSPQNASPTEYAEYARTILSTPPGVALYLPRRCLARIEEPAKLGVVCVSGILWVTQLGVYEDFVLTPEQVVYFRLKGEVLIHAMRDSWYKMLHATQRN